MCAGFPVRAHSEDDPGEMIRATLCLIFIFASACGEIRAQSLQKLLESASGAASEKKAQPSAAEQKDWASKKLLEFQAKAKGLNAEALREELLKASLPETRLDEFLSASEEIVRNYQEAVDTLAAVINKESQRISSASSESIPMPKDDSEADTLRDKLAALRAQAQTAASCCGSRSGGKPSTRRAGPVRTGAEGDRPSSLRRCMRTTLAAPMRTTATSQPCCR